MRSLLLLVSFVSLSVSAQDVIVKKDGSTILSKVLEVNQGEIKYKKYSNLEGPTYAIDKSEIITINYENGEKDTFDNTTLSVSTSSSLSQRLLKKIPDARNAELLSLYNTIYQPTKKVKCNDKAAKHCGVIVGVKNKSIMSTEDIEMNLIGGIKYNPNMGGSEYRGYHIVFTNKTDRVIYIDKGNSFRIDDESETFCYYDNSKQTTVNNGTGTGVTLGLGSVTNVLGIGGVAGQLASGVSVGGSSSFSVSTTYSQQRVIAIPPHGTKELSDYKYVRSSKGSIVSYSDYRELESGEEFKVWHAEMPRGIINNGQIKIYDENDFPWKQEYYITYSTEEDFRTYSILNIELYIHEIIGVQDNWEVGKEDKIIEGLNEHSLLVWNRYLE